MILKELIWKILPINIKKSGRKTQNKVNGKEALLVPDNGI